MKILVLGGLLLAAYFQSGPLFFLLTALVMLGLIARLWLHEITGHLRVSRTMEERLFFGESTTVTLTIANQGDLPIPWVEARESLPIALRVSSRCSRVLRVGAGQQDTISYALAGNRRGLHSVGPLTMAVGDVFGLARRELSLPEPRRLLVYPRILDAQELELPALAMFGNVRARRRMRGDPTRMAGIRDYQPGDPLHDIHWRATAATGSLQVKQYEPATTIQAMIYLDLERADFGGTDPWTAAELAITVAATVANRLVELRQEVGLATNGQITLSAEDEDTFRGPAPKLFETPVPEGRMQPARGTGPGAAEGQVVIPAPIAPAKGRAQLMRMLELLARLELRDAGALLASLLAQSASLPWGSTVVIVTGSVSNEVFVALHRLREVGLLVVLLVVSPRALSAESVALARSLGMRLQRVWIDMPALAISA